MSTILPSVFQFHTKVWDELSGENPPEDKLRGLYKFLQIFMKRRIKTEVEFNIPPKIETKLYVPLSPEQAKWYANLTGRPSNRFRYKALLTGDTAQLSKTKLLFLIMQLRKICNHPHLFLRENPEAEEHVEPEDIIKHSGTFHLRQN